MTGPPPVRRPFHRDEPGPPDDAVPRACKRPRYGTDPTVWHWKYRYNTRDGAAATARKLFSRWPCTVYECGFCGWWHFGRTRRGKPDA